MNIRNQISVALAIFCFYQPWTFAQSGPAASDRSDYQEVSYDDLVNELDARKSRIQVKSQNHSSFDDVKIHAGIGYVNSFSNISTQQQNLNRHTNGIQLSVGMDLFSKNWYSEGIFRNYGVTSSGSEELSLKDLDLRVGYRQNLERVWDYTLSAGLSNRFLNFSDPAKDISVNENTPSLVISTGVVGQVHKNLSLGAEVGARSALVSRTADKNSFDLILRLTTSL